jgi:hypothetical protein
MTTLPNFSHETSDISEIRKQYMEQIVKPHVDAILDFIDQDIKTRYGGIVCADENYEVTLDYSIIPENTFLKNMVFKQLKVVLEKMTGEYIKIQEYSQVFKNGKLELKDTCILEKWGKKEPIAVTKKSWFEKIFG